MLTDLKIKKAELRDKPYRLSDAKGLYIEIHPNGSKYWRLKYRFLGKEKRLAIGVYPKVSLKDARKVTEEAKDQLAQDIDPSQAKKTRKAALIEAHDNNFNHVFLEWHKQRSNDWSNGYANKVLRVFERDLDPYLGSLPLIEITPPFLLSVLRKIEARGATETAHRVKQIVGMVFRYGVATGRAERDITPDLKGALAPHQTRHFAAITEPSKAGLLLQTIEAYQGTVTVRAALKLLPLVLLRTKELRTGEWSEINFEKAEWIISGNKMKMKTDHIVPLSKQALDILREQYLVTGHWGGYIFPSARGPKRPMSENAILNALRTLGFDKTSMTGHGFRAMARTLLDEALEERIDLIEHQLAHAVKDSLGRAYNRTTHLPKRKLMMQRWADYLDVLKAKKSVPDVLTILQEKSYAS